jgi:hypothetical protein
MPLLVKHGYRNNDLRLLNQWCWCFLQALLTVADVLVTDSSKVSADSWQVAWNVSRRLSYTWPQTESPAAQHWVIWRQALTEILALSSNPQLEWNLGKWNQASASQWNWLYDPISEKLFHLKGALWVTIWRPKGRQGLQSVSHSFSKGHRVPGLPMNLRPVLVWQKTQQHKVQVTGMVILVEEKVNNSQTTTFNEHLHRFWKHNPKDAWILDELEVVEDHMDVI